MRGDTSPRLRANFSLATLITFRLSALPKCASADDHSVMSYGLATAPAPQPIAAQRAALITLQARMTHGCRLSTNFNLDKGEGKSKRATSGGRLTEKVTSSHSPLNPFPISDFLPITTKKCREQKRNASTSFLS